ncbi:hypothetical protein F7R21_27610 [Burkholderia latens]|uniref:Uncharacterized protein n=1 Tax=Burkholderia latens TaxID=488446 RepID=A0A6H9SSH8_9BURK|nr:hypothetical protein F7R21_27610 [Burkholderia latens]
MVFCVGSPRPCRRTCFANGLLVSPLRGAAVTFLCLPKKSNQKKGASLGGRQRWSCPTSRALVRPHVARFRLFASLSLSLCS